MADFIVDDDELSEDDKRLVSQLQKIKQQFGPRKSYDSGSSDMEAGYDEI